MGIDGSVTGSACQILVLTIRNVKMSLGVTVLLSQTKVNHIDLVAAFSDAHQEVIRLDISMDKRLGVYVLNSGDELIGQKEHSLQGELSVAKVEQILQARPKEIEHHGIVITLSSEPTDKRDTNTTSK